MVHRVADGKLQRLDELLKALEGGLAASDVLLVHAVGAHHAPLVMVAEVAAVRILTAEPDLDEVVEAAVFIDLAGRDVAVIVDQRLMLRIVMEQMLRGLGFQQEILVHKRFHVTTS